MTQPLFETSINEINVHKPSEQSLEKFNLAVESIRTHVLDAGYTPVLNSSYGKDSVVTKMATIKALKSYNAETGNNQKLIVATALCGGMESPVVYTYVQSQIANLKAYAQENGLDIEVVGVAPNFDENYLLQMVAGKTIQTFSKGKAQCSVDVKQSPIRRMVKALADDNYVTILGTRFAESKSRSSSMSARNEAFNRITTDANGRMTIPPIANMSDDEVFEIIRKASWFQMGVSLYEDYECPVDAGAVIDLYGMGSEHSCSTKAFLEGVEGEFDIGGTCDNMSNRFGCWTCGRCGPVDQKHSAISKQRGYEWLQLFLSVREFLMASEYNYDVRTWLNKKVDAEGSLLITLGSYSPEFCKQLLRFVLTLRAETGYETISDSELLWVMIQWMRYGFPEPFEVINIRNEILLGGARYYPTEEEMAHHAKKPTPTPVKVSVADSEYGNHESNYKAFIGEKDNNGWTSDFVGEHDATAFFEHFWFSSKYDVTRGEMVSQELQDFSWQNCLPPVSQFQLLTSFLSAHRKDGKYYEFTPARARASNAMMQRASLLHRLGLREHLSDREYLINTFINDTGFKLVA